MSGMSEPEVEAAGPQKAAKDSDSLPFPKCAENKHAKPPPSSPRLKRERRLSLFGTTLLLSRLQAPLRDPGERRCVRRLMDWGDTETRTLVMFSVSVRTCASHVHLDTARRRENLSRFTTPPCSAHQFCRNTFATPSSQASSGSSISMVSRTSPRAPWQGRTHTRSLRAVTWQHLTSSSAPAARLKRMRHELEERTCSTQQAGPGQSLSVAASAGASRRTEWSLLTTCNGQVPPLR